ncbi:hypothetical protein OVA03_09125 [Asticcacaulis sp. SL142]|uniref:hypothetical protein n=1 Tax=Asticcacaulis sp. SL142 TaxID=2995155 RepID=UPI00226CE043|nr:hypothetical protein [Asticcacaulis sp. SL142]WAC46879.1 hypothetical protein OVA03_09125 [Asticcacaulis sp. SL142]
MRLTTPALMGLCILIAPIQAEATTLVGKDFTCPIGGAKFEATVYGSWFGYGARPDGRPLGTSRGYVPIPECPDNHLLLYREFSAEDLKSLAKLIASDEYRHMTNTESPFYRAAWLEYQLNPSPVIYAQDLLRATWYVDNDPDKKTRYRDLFLKVAEPLPVSGEDTQSLILRLRVLNVYRETGQFERAHAGLKALPVKTMAKGLPRNEKDTERLDEASLDRWFFVKTARQLETLILRKDAAVNPIEVLPDWMAEEECYFRTPKSVFETAFCSTPKMRKILKEDKEYFEAVRQFYDYDGPIQSPPPPPSELLPSESSE